jgi:hypothetical protein
MTDSSFTLRTQRFSESTSHPATGQSRIWITSSNDDKVSFPSSAPYQLCSSEL